MVGSPLPGSCSELCCVLFWGDPLPPMEWKRLGEHGQHPVGEEVEPCAPVWTRGNTKAPRLGLRLGSQPRLPMQSEGPRKQEEGKRSPGQAETQDSALGEVG